VAGLFPGAIQGTITLRDCSLSTSRTPRPDAPEGAIIDPRNGKPVAAPRVVTVQHRDAAHADAWSTALIVLGRDGTGKAQKSGVEFLLEDAEGVVKTQGFQLETFR
jgi:thiamine biosynthesis lipoprotein ApbE